MKQQILAHLAHVQGQISAPLTPIDYQSLTAQVSAQIVRKNKYAVIALSSGYTSHAKQKKVNVPKQRNRHFSLTNYTPKPKFQNYTRLRGNVKKFMGPGIAGPRLPETGQTRTAAPQISCPVT